MKKLVGILSLALLMVATSVSMAGAAEPRLHLDVSAGVTNERTSAENTLTYDTLSATLSTQIRKLTLFGTVGQNYLQHGTNGLDFTSNKRQMTTLGGGAVLRLSPVTNIQASVGTRVSSGLMDVNDALLKHVINVTVTTRAF